MADDKKSAPKNEIHWMIAFLPLIIIGILLVIGARMGGETIFGQKISNPEQDIIAGKRNILNIYEWIGSGDIEYRTKVINTSNAIVRNQPAGGIVGTQKKT